VQASSLEDKMTLKEFITKNPDTTFNLIPEIDDDTFNCIVRVSDNSGNELQVFIYKSKDEAEDAIEDAITIINESAIKQKIFVEATNVLRKEGLDPDNIWSAKFGIADFIFMSSLSSVDAAKLLEKIKEDAHGVVSSLGDGLESGLLFDWETVAGTAVEEAI
jgi:hypothetical protein